MKTFLSKNGNIVGGMYDMAGRNLSRVKMAKGLDVGYGGKRAFPSEKWQQVEILDVLNM